MSLAVPIPRCQAVCHSAVKSTCSRRRLGESADERQHVVTRSRSKNNDAAVKNRDLATSKIRGCEGRKRQETTRQTGQRGDIGIAKHLKTDSKTDINKTSDILVEVPKNAEIRTDTSNKADTKTEMLKSEETQTETETDLIKVVKRPEFASTEVREKSFHTHNWPKGDTHKPKDMAEAGLYYMGEGDKVRCYCCGGGLIRWEEDDIPMVEHEKHFPKCHYVRFMKLSTQSNTN